MCKISQPYLRSFFLSISIIQESFSHDSHEKIDSHGFAILYSHKRWLRGCNLQLTEFFYTCDSRWWSESFGECRSIRAPVTS